MIDVIVLEEKNSLSAIALVENGILQEIDFRDKSKISEDSIFLGKISGKIELPNGKTGFFVNIGDSSDAFLNLEEEGLENTNLSEGQSLVVQVLQSAREEKGAKVVREIKIAGKNLVYCPYQISVGISSKIKEEKETENYRKFVIENTTSQEGWVLRTSVLEASFDEVLEEMKSLRVQYENIRNKARTLKAPSLLYSKGDIVYEYINAHKDSLKKIVLNNHNIEKDIKEKYQDSFEVEFSREPFDDYGVDEALNDALLKEVRLKSGGTITIEETKAFVAIDVDSDRDSGGGSFSRLNIEAVVEIARQIKLRSLSGKIVIDFAGSSDYKYMKPIVDAMRDELKKDNVNCYFAGLSRGGNVEIVRSRRRPSLRELFTTECDSCQGTGRVSRWKIALFAKVN